MNVITQISFNATNYYVIDIFGICLIISLSTVIISYFMVQPRYIVLLRRLCLLNTACTTYVLRILLYVIARRREHIIADTVWISFDLFLPFLHWHALPTVLYLRDVVVLLELTGLLF